MRNRLLEGRASQGLVAGLAPPFDPEVVETGLGEMMRDKLRLGGRALGLVAQDFSGAAVQRLAAAPEQALVGCVLDQRVLEAIDRLAAGALDEHEVRVDQPIERRIVGRNRRRRRQRARARRKNRARAPRRSARPRARRQAIEPRRRFEQAKSDMQQAMRLSPRDPDMGLWHLDLGSAELGLGHFDAAIEEFRKADNSGCCGDAPPISLVAAYALAGRMEEAKSALAEARRIDPKLTIKWMVEEDARAESAAPVRRPAQVFRNEPESQTPLAVLRPQPAEVLGLCRFILPAAPTTQSHRTGVISERPE